MNWVVFVIALLVPATVLAQNCGVFKNDQGQTFDLTSLSTSGYYYGSEVTYSPLEGYTYFFNFCKNTSLPANATFLVNLPSFAYQCDLITYKNCMPIGTSLDSITYSTDTSQVAIRYVTENCCQCRSGIRRTTIYLSCNASATVPIVTSAKEVDYPSCLYEIQVQAAAACPLSNSTDCCAAHNSPGCAEPNMEACVCKVAPQCCSHVWNQTCVNLVDSLGCGACNLGKCCVPHDTKGCEDRQTSRCVCEKQPECCTQSWSDSCVRAVNTYGCGKCGLDCCSAGQCSDQKIRDCVCSRDVYCCAVYWDATCAEEAAQFGCANCTLSSHSLSPLNLPRPLHHSLLNKNKN